MKSRLLSKAAHTLMTAAAFLFLAVPILKAATTCAAGQKLDTLSSQCVTANSAVLISSDGSRTTFDQTGTSVTTGYRASSTNAAANINGVFSSGTGTTVPATTMTVSTPNPNNAVLASGANAANPFGTKSAGTNTTPGRIPGYHTTDSNAQTNVNGTYSTGTIIDNAPATSTGTVSTSSPNSVSASFGGSGEPGTTGVGATGVGGGTTGTSAASGSAT